MCLIPVMDLQIIHDITCMNNEQQIGSNVGAEIMGGLSDRNVDVPVVTVTPVAIKKR